MPCTYLELFDVQKCRFCQHRLGKSCRSPRRCKALLVSALPAAATVVLTKLTISGAQSIADAVCRRTALHILNAAWAAAFCFRAAAFRQLWNNICGTYRKCGLCEGKSRGEITARTSVRKNKFRQHGQIFRLSFVCVYGELLNKRRRQMTCGAGGSLLKYLEDPPLDAGLVPEYRGA